MNNWCMNILYHPSCSPPAQQDNVVMVRRFKGQLVKSSKHKHENVVDLDRLSVCVCVWLWPGICRSGGCLQRTEVRPQEILPHAWCAPTASLTGERDERVKRRAARLHLRCHGYRASVFSGSGRRGVSREVASWPSPEANPLAYSRSPSHTYTREETWSWSWVGLVNKVQQMEVGSNRSEDTKRKTQRCFKWNDYFGFKNIWRSSVGLSPRRCWRWHWQ